MSDFKLGVKGEGFFFFLPDSYNKDTKIIGNQLRRTINGKASRDVTALKKNVALTFEFLDVDETAALYELFLRNIEDGKVLTFGDEEEEFDVIWASDSFGINDRKANEDIYWSGTITLEEV